MNYLKEYRSIGLTPIPVRGKVARYPWKDYQFNFQDFTKPGVNIGIRTGLLPSGDYFYVIDLDSKELLGLFYESHPTLMGVPLVSTGKGWHIYLTWKEQPRTRHYVGIDIIANGYVLAPPSIHPSGHVYKFIIPLRGLPPCYNPEWLSTGSHPPLLIAHGPQACYAQDIQSHTGEQFDFGGVPEGQRHNTLIRCLGILMARYYIEEEALAEVREWNQKCMPPLSQDELEFAVKSCWEKWDQYER